MFNTTLAGHHLPVRSGPVKPVKKVLIVDDEFLIRYSLQNLIEGENLIALTADTGLHALKLFQEEKPDIVILDIRLPDTNGLTLLKAIKEINSAVIVIMITACPDIQNSVEAMKMGALDYLEKPIDFDKMKNLLNSVKQNRVQRDQSSGLNNSFVLEVKR